MSRVHAERFDVRDNVLATFHPRRANRWNTQIGDLFLRKWRGNRNRWMKRRFRRALFGAPRWVPYRLPA